MIDIGVTSRSSHAVSRASLAAAAARARRLSLARPEPCAAASHSAGHRRRAAEFVCRRSKSAANPIAGGVCVARRSPGELELESDLAWIGGRANSIILRLRPVGQPEKLAPSREAQVANFGAVDGRRRVGTAAGGASCRCRSASLSAVRQRRRAATLPRLGPARLGAAHADSPARSRSALLPAAAAEPARPRGQRPRNAPTSDIATPAGRLEPAGRQSCRRNIRPRSSANQGPHKW
jgi:hypothetical protein